MSVDGIVTEIANGVFSIENCPIDPKNRHWLAQLIGQKGAGLALIPSPWTPPFISIAASVYDEWRSKSGHSAFASVLDTAVAAAEAARSWPSIWAKGICVRSSATMETLNERGAHQSVELAADFDAAMITRAIIQIYEHFDEVDAEGTMAIVVQARVATLAHGHLSNEQRVSKTINQWKWEYEPEDKKGGRFNSQRETPPDAHSSIHPSRGRPADLTKVFRQVGRWSTQLGVGRTHLEWGASSDALWIFQLDLEIDQPDRGLNPTNLLRDGDCRPAGKLPAGSPLHVADFAKLSGWKKIDKIAHLRDEAQPAYPTLIYITGAEFLEIQKSGRDLVHDLNEFAHGRVVCRTDCSNDKIGRLNLPRTHTVSSEEAVSFIGATIDKLGEQNASPNEICFILHKFIPSVTAVWAVARVGDHVVRVDSLWGLPDGLQYLPHDTFEFDVLQNRQSTERLNYKPAYLQELETGNWQVVKVARRLGRSRSLPASDLSYVARHTYEVAKKLNQDIQIMWFCRIPEKTGLPSNIPWFSMKPHTRAAPQTSVSPLKHPFIIQSFSDLDAAENLAKGQFLLQIDPDDPELFRSNEFLDRIRQIALAKEFPIGLTGSILSHAFYVLEKSGLAVIAMNEPTRNRIRQRRVFRKLVRDDIPTKITQGGETVTLAEIAKEEARSALVAKLFEESFELLAADTPQDVMAELADLLEVVQSLSVATGVDWRDIVQAASEKRASRGSFEKSVVLLETASPGWLAEKRQSASFTIPLKSLGQITSKGGIQTVPFSALLGDKCETSLILDDGIAVTLGIGSSGITISPLKIEQETHDQFALPLDK